MESHHCNIIAIGQVTHDVKNFRVEKPAGYAFNPGQATEVSVNKPGWEHERRPFTFTSLGNDPWIEFTIKRYADHDGVTNQLHQLKEGDQLILHDVWGAISYKGPGYFIAGGAGITPFIAILRQHDRERKLEGNTLFFSNKTTADIIYEKELAGMLGDKAVFILTREAPRGYRKGMINKQFLDANVRDFKKHFYVCGPDKMVSDINDLLIKAGAATDLVVFEK